MELVKSYLVDEAGNIKDVVVDYETFKKMEEALLSYGLGKAMEEVANDDEVDLDTAKRIAGFKQ
jgi:hypothetical protein